MHESQKHYAKEKPDEREYMIYDSIYMKLEKKQIIPIESRLAVARGCGGREGGDSLQRASKNL